MRMGKWTATALIVGLAGFSLFGCSSSGTNDTAKKEAANSAAPAASATKAPIKITYFQNIYGGTPASKDGPGLKEFNKKFNVDWDVSFVPGDAFKQQLSVKIASGDIPDVIDLDGTTDMIAYAKQGMLLPLDDYIKKYDSLKNIPNSVWDAMKVNGHIYGLPKFFTQKLGKVMVIRKDWLDNLGLQMPTNYDELEKVAIAFTNNNPNKDGRKTYGLALAGGISPPAVAGAYWDIMPWYFKNAEGQYIPGMIGEGSKQRIQFLAGLYKAGAIPKDWATMKGTDAKKDFFSGKAGIYADQSFDRGDTDYKALESIDPKAEVVAIPPFKQPDGGQGYTALSGYYGLDVLSVKLKDNPEKINKILEILDYWRTFIPPDQMNPKNANFDWNYGHEGKGYTMVNGVASIPQDKEGLNPASFVKERPWPAKESDLQLEAQTSDPLLKHFIQSEMAIANQYPYYVDPINRVNSDVYNQKFWDIWNVVADEQTKMIVGQEPVSNWDQMVQNWMNKGGKEIVDDVNKQIKAAGIQGEWTQK